MSKAFFSVGWPLIVTGSKMIYDLYVNASGRSDKEKFVRIFPIDEILTEEDKDELHRKYPQLYIPETQRSYYLQSLVKTPEVDDETKTEVIKDSAVKYLGNLFDESREFNTEILSETIEGCRETVPLRAG